jgi:putative ABC transport system substrate-binding protein
VDRRAFLAGLCGILAPPFGALAQQTGKVYRVGYLSGIADPSAPRIETFRQAMDALGWKDGHNVAIEYRSAGGNSDRLGEQAADLVRRGLDVIVAQIPAAVLALAKETHTIPIVMVNAPDPVQLGLVGSLARPGGNITGLTTLSGELSGKQFELLKALIPRLARVAILSNPTNPWHPLAVEGIAARAKSLQVLINVVSVREPDQLAASFAELTDAMQGSWPASSSRLSDKSSRSSRSCSTAAARGSAAARSADQYHR